MSPRRLACARAGAAVVTLTAALAACGGGGAPASAPTAVTAGPAARASRRPRRVSQQAAVPLRAGRIPAPVSRRDVYAADRANQLAPLVGHDPARVYVPNSTSNTVDVISQRTGRIVDHFAVGALPQHVTPAWDLRTLWVTNDRGNSLTPIDPRTGRHGAPARVRDPYNLYFTADGRRAIVVAEAHRALDFREPHTMRLRHTLSIPQCAGIDHMDFTADGRRALASCEFAGRMVVVDLVRQRVVKTIDLRAGAMPQDVKLSPDGRTFYVADMASNGVWLIDARRMRKIRMQPTGLGAHGLYPSRDARVLYVSNREEGSITVISFRTRHPVAKWRLPGGGSPDMGGVSADGRLLWLSGRYDAEVYAISTRTGRLLHRVPVGAGPHGMAVWPQPGRYSIGHTGIMRLPTLAPAMPRRATTSGDERTSLDGTTADVLVCGASFGGLAVARGLAGAGAKVLVVDRYEIGERATSACAAPTPWLEAMGVRRAIREEIPCMRFGTPHGAFRYRLPWSWSSFDYRELCRELWQQCGDARFETAKVERRTPGGVLTDRGELHAPLVVDALGWRRVLAGDGNGYQPPDAPLSRGLEVHPHSRAGRDLDVWVDRSLVREGY